MDRKTFRRATVTANLMGRGKPYYWHEEASPVELQALALLKANVNRVDMPACRLSNFFSRNGKGIHPVQVYPMNKR